MLVFGLFDRMGRASPRAKRLVLLAVDTALMVFSLYAAMALRLNSATLAGATPALGWLFLVVSLLGVAIILGFRLPWIRLAAMQSDSLVHFGHAAIALAMTAMAVSYLMQVQVPRSVPIIGAVLFFGLAVLARAVALRILIRAGQRTSSSERVAIYGAGAAGTQLASALRQSREMQPVLFFDDNTALSGLVVAGLPVFSSALVPETMQRHKVKRMLVAMPSAPRERVQEVIDRFTAFGFEVQALPSYVDMVKTRGRESRAATITTDPITRASDIDLSRPELARTYSGRSILVTGAAGDIGSELALELLACRPARVVLFDANESALLVTRRAMEKLASERGVEMVARIGNTTDAGRMQEVIAEQKIDVVFHAAGQTHPTFGEENIIEAAKSNVIGTRIAALAAINGGAELFVLVSNERAQVPSTALEATWRLAELVVQDLATRSGPTRIGVVRLSPGVRYFDTLLPLFKGLSLAGRAIRLPHAEMTRDFQAKTDAVRLLITAGAMAGRGEVFALAPTAPARVADVASQFAALRGGAPGVPGRAAGMPIAYTGLRPGEPLHEPALSGGSPSGDGQGQVWRLDAPVLSQIEVAALLSEVNQAIREPDAARFRTFLMTRLGGPPAPLDPEVPARTTPSGFR